MFLLPLLIFGSSLAVLPLAIHLWRKQQTTPIRWAAMQFLHASQLTGRRSRRIQHWLLLLTRMGILITLALLLARPFLASPYFAPLSQGQAMDVALVIDHALSMGRRASTGETAGGGGGTLFDQALNQSEQIRNLLRDADTLSIVLAEHTPNLRTAAGGLPHKPAASEILDALRQLPAPRTDSNIPDAVMAARELLAHGPNTRKLIIILSDEQRSGFEVPSDVPWQNALGASSTGRTPEAARTLPVYLVGLSATATLPNLSVQPLALQPPFVGVGRPLQVLATISNSGSTTTGGGKSPESPVQLLVDGQVVETQTLPALPAGESRTLHFEYRFRSGAGSNSGGSGGGAHFVEVRSTAPDALEIDNSATAALQVYDQLPVLVIASEPAAFLMAALNVTQMGLPEGSGLIRPRLITPRQLGQVDLHDYAAVILYDPVSKEGGEVIKPELLARLTDYVQSGHGLWLIAGPHAEASYYNDPLTRAGLFTGKLGTLKNPPRPAAGGAATSAGLDLRLPEHPTLALLARSAKDPLAQALIHAWWQLTPPPGTNSSRVLVAQTANAAAPDPPAANLNRTDGDPIILEHDVGGLGGRVLVWTTSLDGTWNNLPLLPAFVPLVHESIYHLASSSSGGTGNAGGTGGRLNLNAGEPLVYTLPAAEAAPTALTLQRPDGRTKTLALQRQGGGGRWAVTEPDTFLPGLYKLNLARARGGAGANVVDSTNSRSDKYLWYAVNFDRRVLDPAPLTGSDLAWLKERLYLNDRLTSGRAVADVLGVSQGGLELWPHAAALLFLLLMLETFLTWRAVRWQATPAPIPSLAPTGGSA